MEPEGRAPRIARLLTLAHKLDAMVRSGEIHDYAELARLGHISPALLTQIMALRHLAPAIHEYVLFLPEYVLFLPAADARSSPVRAAQDRARAALGSPARTVREHSQQMTQRASHWFDQ